MYQTISHYRIIKKLGEGGMGEVYLAEDTKLRRKVALKFLTTNLTKNEELLHRFEQEAQAASALSHPNVAHIYEIGDSGGTHFIAMEYIEGEPLDQKIGGSPAAVAVILDIAIQIADALDEAHGQGIIHRDIKSSNIMITPRGRVKVLDFGLAKLSRRVDSNGSASESAIATRVKTSPGVVLGTVNYMSPEQALGREVDHRTDIFSFGVVLYEMATGRLPFSGETVTETIDRIVHAQPEAIARLNYDLPAELEVIIKKALRKDRNQRYQNIHDLLVDLRDLRGELNISERLEYSVASGQSLGQSHGFHITERTTIPSFSTTGRSAPQRTSSAEYIVNEIKRHKTSFAVVAGAILMAVIALGVGLYRFAGRPAKPADAGATIASSSMKIARLTASGKVQSTAVSPDGKYIVYVVKEGAQQSLWLRQVAVSSNVQILAPAEVQYVGETFSPDGNFIYYVAIDANNLAGALYQAPVLGGPPRRILTEITSPITFSPDATHIAFVRWEEQTTGEYILMIADADGTNERRLAVRKGHEWFGSGVPGWSPDGKEIAVSAGSEIGDFRNFVIVVDVESGEQKEFSSQKFPNDGHVCWLVDGSGMVMNARDQESYLNQIWLISYPGGEARQITHDLNEYIGASLTAGSKALVTVQHDITDNIWVAPFDNLSQTKQITSGRLEGRLGLGWAPDGRIVYTSSVSGNIDIWIMNSDGTNQKQLTDDPHLDYMPTVSPDGRYVVFDSKRAGSVSLWRMDLDGGNLTQLTSGQSDFMPQVSPDGRWVVFDSWRSGKDTLWKIPIEGGEPVQLTDKFTYWAGISPDGKLIACYYQEHPNSPLKALIMSFEGGQPLKIFDLPTSPGLVGEYGGPIVWAADGRSIMYLDMRGGSRNLWRQTLEGGKPVQLTNYTSNENEIRRSVLSRDGKQIAFMRETTTSDVVLISDFR